MEEKDLQQQLHLLHEQVEAAVSLTEDLKLDLLASIDHLKLEIEALKRVMQSLHPDFARLYETTKERVLQEIDPEASN